MVTTGNVRLMKATPEHRNSIESLLSLSKLPTGDLPTLLDHFFVALDGNNVVGVIGLEVYGDDGLLRSMAVDAAYRNQNIASRLVEALEAYAKAQNIDSIYLLTETASEYFVRKGYQRIIREDVPHLLHASSEFSHVCPVSATVMKKILCPE